MPAGTAFSTTVDDVSFQFVTSEAITQSGSGGAVTFNNVKIYEGTYLTTKYLVDTSSVEQNFLLPDSRSDTSTLTVKVQNSASGFNYHNLYKMLLDISQLTSSSSVYYLQEVENGRHEVYFGDGSISKALSDGNIVILQYVVTNKTANGASSLLHPHQ